MERIIRKKPITHSELFEIGKKHDVYISSYVIEEVADNLLEKFAIILEEYHLQAFLQKSHINYIPSQQLLPRGLECINDMDDLQILQDAIACKAEILLTNNIKDFNVDKILETYNILVKRQYNDFI